MRLSIILSAPALDKRQGKNRPDRCRDGQTLSTSELKKKKKPYKYVMQKIWTSSDHRGFVMNRSIFFFYFLWMKKGFLLIESFFHAIWLMWCFMGLPWGSGESTVRALDYWSEDSMPPICCSWILEQDS